MTFRPPVIYNRPLGQANQAPPGFIQGRVGGPSGGLQFAGNGQWKAYDWPNPTLRKDAAYLLAATRSESDVWSNRLLDLLKGKDRQFAGAGQWKVYDYPNPPGYRRAVDLLTFISPTEIQLIGKDRQFRSFGQWTAYDYPNPSGYQRAVDLLTWIDFANPTVPVTAAPFNQGDWPNPRGPIPLALTWIQSPNQDFPRKQTDWPNPIGPVQNYDLRTFLNPLELTLIGQDKFYGEPGQAVPNYNWPVPQGSGFPLDLRTFILNLQQGTLAAPFVQPPFSLLNWPNPGGYAFSQDLRSFLDANYVNNPIPPAVVVIVVPPAEGGGASGVKRYRAPSWGAKKKKLLDKVEAVEKLIEAKREQIDYAQDLYRMQRLIEQLQDLQRRLMKLLEQLDELNKQMEEEEVLLIYSIYRTLH